MKIAALDRLDWSSIKLPLMAFGRLRMTASNGTVTVTEARPLSTIRTLE